MSRTDKSVEASWCFFRGSDTVRDAIEFRLKQTGRTAKSVCDETGIDPYRMSLYRNNRIPNVNQFQLYKICQALGIGVKINVELR